MSPGRLPAVQRWFFQLSGSRTSPDACGQRRRRPRKLSDRTGVTATPARRVPGPQLVLRSSAQLDSRLWGWEKLRRVWRGRRKPRTELGKQPGPEGTRTGLGAAAGVAAAGGRRGFVLDRKRERRPGTENLGVPRESEGTGYSEGSGDSWQQEDRGAGASTGVRARRAQRARPVSRSSVGKCWTFVLCPAQRHPPGKAIPPALLWRQLHGLPGLPLTMALQGCELLRTELP